MAFNINNYKPNRFGNRFGKFMFSFYDLFLKGKIPTIKEDLCQNNNTPKIPELAISKLAGSNKKEKPDPPNLNNSSKGTTDSFPSSRRSTLKSSSCWTHATGAR